MQKKLKGVDLPKGFEGQRSTHPEENDGAEEAEDNDEEWYRKEVGQAPDKDLFDKAGDRKRRGSFKDNRFKKKRKMGDKDGSRRKTMSPKMTPKFKISLKRGSSSHSKRVKSNHPKKNRK